MRVPPVTIDRPTPEPTSDPASPLVLVAAEGPYAGRTFALAGTGPVTLGRLDGLPLALPDDPYLSRTHCLFEANHDTARVNSKRVDTVDLLTGDLVLVGGSGPTSGILARSISHIR